VSVISVNVVPVQWQVTVATCSTVGQLRLENLDRRRLKTGALEKRWWRMEAETLTGLDRRIHQWNIWPSYHQISSPLKLIRPSSVQLWHIVYMPVWPWHDLYTKTGSCDQDTYLKVNFYVEVYSLYAFLNMRS